METVVKKSNQFVQSSEIIASNNTWLTVENAMVDWFCQATVPPQTNMYKEP